MREEEARKKFMKELKEAIKKGYYERKNQMDGLPEERFIILSNIDICVEPIEKLKQILRSDSKKL